MNSLENVTKPLTWSMAMLLVAFVAGCGGGGGGSPILGGGGGAVLAPTVTAVAPSDGNTAVGINNTVITAQFSEPMSPINASNFTVVCATPCAKQPTGTVALDVAKTKATFTLTNSPLLELTNYTATVSGAKSLATGLALASPKIWNFKTVITADTTLPSVTLTVPANGTANVATNAAITAVFSEEMIPATIDSLSPATGSFTLTCTAGPTPGVCVAPTVSGDVSYVVGSRTAVFTPVTPAALEAGKTYHATVSGAATDLAGNTLTAGLVPNPWTFTTATVTPLDSVAPKVSSTNPADGATNVDINQAISATFNEAMKATTITAPGTFTLTGPGGIPVISGDVTYDALNNIATFTPILPTKPLALDTVYTATISSAATDLAGNHLVVPATGGLPVPNSWSFRTAAAPVTADLAIDLGSAATFGIAANAALTSSGVTLVNGDIALAPFANTPTCGDATGSPSNCLVATLPADPTGLNVNGTIYWDDGTADSQSAIALAVKNDLNTAFVTGMAKPTPIASGYLSGQIAGKTIYPGIYPEGSTLDCDGTLGHAVLNGGGDVNSVFIFQVGSSITSSSGCYIDLQNGAKARNVWFLANASANVGVGSTWNGNILAGVSISVLANSTVNGRLLAGALGAGVFSMTTTATGPASIVITVPPN